VIVRKPIVPFHSFSCAILDETTFHPSGEGSEITVASVYLVADHILASLSYKCTAVIQLLYNPSSMSPASSFQSGQSIAVIKNKVPNLKFRAENLTS